MASANQPDTRAELAELLKRKSELSVREDWIMATNSVIMGVVLWCALNRILHLRLVDDVIVRRDPCFYKYLELLKKLPLPKNCDPENADS